MMGKTYKSVTNLMDNCDKKVNRLIYILMVLSIFMFTSCGARKVELEQQKARTQALAEMVLSIQNRIESNTRMYKVATKKIVEPVDPKLPSTYNGQDFQNARITEEETTTDSTATMNDNSTTDINSSSQTNSSSESVKRNVDRQGNAKQWKGIIWGLVLLVALILYGKYKKWF